MRLADALQALGQRVDQDFEEGLAQRPATPVQEALTRIVGEMTNVYVGYDLSGLVTRYQQLLSASPTASAWMTAKYQALEQRVDHLAQTGAAMDLYAGPMTHDSHQFLFGTLMRAMVGEGAVLGMLAALYLLGYEKVHRTEGMVYTTCTGRNMVRGKIVAAVTAGMALYLLLTGLTLGIYFAQWDYSGLWSASVSSQFNFLTDMMVRRPFLTWADFTVAQYLVACLALGGAYRKAARRRPDFDGAVRRCLDELARLEGENCPSLDRTADTLARLLQAAAPEEGIRGRVLGQLLYHLGRWIYLADARDDLAEDRAAGRYNPVAARYGPGGDDAALALTMDQSLAQMGAALQLGDFGCRLPILENIIYLGLPLVQKSVFDGSWAQIKKQKIWRHNT